MKNKAYWKAVRAHATTRQQEYIDNSHLHVPACSQSDAALAMGIDRRAVDRGIQSAIDKATEAGAILDSPAELKILSVDIETAPMIGYLWSIWNEVRSTDMVEHDWYTISYAYKWLGKDEVYGKALNQCKGYTAGSEDDSELIEDLWRLFDEADIVVAHNGDKFDIKKIKARMLQHVMIPPSPFRTIDTLKIMKREFAFTSNRLDSIAQALLGEGKMDTGGIKLWIGCIKNDPEAWAKMLDYNIRDVDILERVYLAIRAWDRSHPNVAIMTDITEPACTVCTSTDLEEIINAKAATNVSLFRVYRCKECGHVNRGRHNTRTKMATQGGLVNAR